MKIVLSALLAALFCAGCNTTITEETDTSKRNLSPNNNFANSHNARQFQERTNPQHGNADNP